MNELVNRGNDLVSCWNSLVSRENDLVNRGNVIVSCWSESLKLWERLTNSFPLLKKVHVPRGVPYSKVLEYDMEKASHSYKVLYFEHAN